MSETEPDFDVVVVGAGVAGCVCAFALARAGRSVLLVDRGEAPGSKNLSGGVFYWRVLEELFPDFLHEAPIERAITRNRLTFLNPDSSVSVDYEDQTLAHPVNAVTVLRAKLDAWLAEQCENAGVAVMPGIRVDELIREDPSARISGIRADGDQIFSRVVVAADGVNSFLARSAGLREKPTPNQLAVGVKGVYGLAPEAIEERFGIGADEGVACSLVGDCTEGVGGGGFCYTNRESVSAGIVVRLDDLVRHRAASAELFEHFVAHPAIARLIGGGNLVEYGCHLVAEGGLSMRGKLSGDGIVIVGDAAGFTLNTGFTVRGMDLAAGSALAAAQAISSALEEGDTSAQALSRYDVLIEKSFVGADMKTYRRAPAFMERPRLYERYGQFGASMMKGIFDMDTTPRKHLLAVARESMKSSGVRPTSLISDALGGIRSL